MALDYVILTNHRPRHQQLTPPTNSQLLISAIKHSQLSAVVDLVESGVDLNVKGDNCWTPLSLACQLGRVDVVQYLLHRSLEFREKETSFKCRERDNYCDVNHNNDYGDTPLICAAREGHKVIVQHLLDAGADPNLPNQYSNLTPLLAAIDGGHVEVVTQLLSYDADIQLTDNVKLTPLYTAIKLKDGALRENITQQLIQAGCDVNIGSQDHAPIFLAARLGYLSVTKNLCEANCDIDVANKYGVTPIYEAAIKGHNSVVSYLLSQGCHVNRHDMYGVSPLHAAALFNNPTAVELLLEAGGSVKQRDQTGRCAVHAAIEHGFAKVVEVFLRHGVDITQPPTSIKRLSTLGRVFDEGHLEVVRVLVSGCSKLPFNKCLSASQVFRSNPQLLKMLLLSGLQGIPADFTRTKPISYQEMEMEAEVTQILVQHRTSPMSLQNICRIHVRRSLGNKIFWAVKNLPVPTKLKDFITFQ